MVARILTPMGLVPQASNVHSGASISASGASNINLPISAAHPIIMIALLDASTLMTASLGFLDRSDDR